MADLLTQIRDRWFMFAFLISMVLWYGSVNSRLNGVEAKQQEQAQIVDDVISLKIDVAVIKSTVLDIKDILK